VDVNEEPSFTEPGMQETCPLYGQVDLTSEAD
jgi:hypothetical protein